MEEPILKLINVTKQYKDSFTLQNINLDIFKGKTVCVIGPSGAGKTTLLKCINLLEIIDFGQIIFNGKQVYNADNKRKRVDVFDFIEHRKRFGYVFQNFNLWPHMTVIENIIEGPVTAKREPKVKMVEKGMELLKKVGLQDKAYRYPDNLSGGEIQRTAIARALAMEPDVLLLDEITSALDVELVGEVLDILEDLTKEGKTMVVVTHEMQFAREVGDFIIFLDSGKIVEMDKPEVFFENPKDERTKKFLSSIIKSKRYF